MPYYDTELADRAVRAYYRAMGDQAPIPSRSDTQTFFGPNGYISVEVRNTNGILAKYSVRGNGRLRRNWPR